jgi:o-succinylbenzoate synthase
MAIKLGLQTRTLRIAEQRNSRQSWTERASVLVTLSDASGTLGLGEATPLDGYGPDTFEQALAALRALSAQSLAAALDAQNLDAALAALAPLLPAHCKSARFALETAALQYFAQQQQRSRVDLLSSLLGGAAAESSSSAVEPAQLLDLHDDWLTALHDFRRQGSRCFKVKIGLADAERGALQDLRRQLLSGEQLRLDANGRLPATLSHSFLASLAPQFVEEPLPALGEPQKLAFPLALDESLTREPESARHWLEAGAVAAIVVKPMCLGLLTALDWCRWARACNVPVVVSHCFDGAVAQGVYKALARAVACNGTAPGLGSQPASALWQEEARSLDDRL